VVITTQQPRIKLQKFIKNIKKYDENKGEKHRMYFEGFEPTNFQILTQLLQ
jgi:hypothetical protein